jgi:tRNA(Ile)-lysidine synthase
MRATNPARLPLARALRRHILSIAPVAPGERVLIALSGGLDSVVLLHLLRFGDVLPGCELIAAHFDHGMRPDSGRDAWWVHGLTRAWDVQLEQERAHDALCNEADARRARYAFLVAAADRVHAQWIMTAHHADDQAETVLFRILRGTSVTGLAGIAERRGRIVRPLLRFSRTRIAAYARAAGLRWREDPSNVDLRFARNRIRRDVLPNLESVRPGVARALTRLGADAAAIERVLQPVLEAAQRAALSGEDGRVVLARDALLSYDPWVRARVLRTAMVRLGAAPGHAGTLAATTFLQAARSGASLHLASGLRMERAFDRIVLSRPADTPPELALVIRQVNAGRGSAQIGGSRVPVAWGPAPEPGRRTEAFDVTELHLPLTVRGWRPGDRIRLPYGTKKLKKLFAEWKLARPERYRVPVVADADSRVLWVVGLVRADCAAPRPEHPTLFITVGE